MRTLAVGSDPSTAGGGRSEVSEWPRSKSQAFAVRQRRNFGHRNRDICVPPAPHLMSCASGGGLSANSGRKSPKSAVKTKVLKSFPRLKCRPYGTPPATRTGCAGLSPSVRIVSAPPSAGRSRGPTLPWCGRDTLCAYRVGVAHRIFCHAPVGAGLPDDPFRRTSYHP